MKSVGSRVFLSQLTLSRATVNEKLTVQMFLECFHLQNILMLQLDRKSKDHQY